MAVPATGRGRPGVRSRPHAWIDRIREAQLDRYCERFAAAGIVALAFDFRHLGSSGGEPRQLVDIPRQYEDCDAVLAHLRGLRGVDPDRIAIWGTSFAGGHAIDAAVRNPWLAAAVAQTPLVDGRRLPPQGSRWRMTLWGLASALRDLAHAARGAAPHYVPVLGPPGGRAVICAPDLWESYTERWGLFERRDEIEGILWRNEVPARLLLQVLRHRPAQRAHLVGCPLLVQIVELDSVARTRSSSSRRRFDEAPRHRGKRIRRRLSQPLRRGGKRAALPPLEPVAERAPHPLRLGQRHIHVRLRGG